MPDAIAQYQYIRQFVQTNPIDACTDAAQYSGVKFYDLVDALIAADIDVKRLSVLL
jgi:phosphatidylserine/phosphatidylglycerophosphate/cardiolipin synthase-like enzyme